MRLERWNGLGRECRREGFYSSLYQLGLEERRREETNGFRRQFRKRASAPILCSSTLVPPVPFRDTKSHTSSYLVAAFPYNSFAEVGLSNFSAAHPGVFRFSNQHEKRERQKKGNEP